MRITITNRRRVRTGFTLVELLVAAALSILIMAVMATAFQSGLQTLSTLKSLGDMAERLKTAETMLRSDLDAEHFAITDWGDDSPGIQHLSDLRYDTLPPSPSPKGGYFKIRQGNPSLPEGVDADGLISTSADGNRQHQLSFTIRRRPRSPEGFFSAHLGNLQTMATSPPDDFTAIMSQRITDVMPLDGNLYVTTDNRPGGDVILRVRPT